MILVDYREDEKHPDIARNLRKAGVAASMRWLTDTTLSPREQKDADFFWSRILLSHDCWWWPLSLNDGGYGQAWFNGQFWMAHRLAWHLAIAPLGKGAPGGDGCILHRCDNRRCVRPSHLFLGSQTENIEDMVAKRRQRGARGERNCHAKLTPVDVAAIRSASRKYGSQIQLAHQYGVTREAIRNIWIGKTWS